MATRRTSKCPWHPQTAPETGPRNAPPSVGLGKLPGVPWPPQSPRPYHGTVLLGDRSQDAQGTIRGAYETAGFLGDPELTALGERSAWNEGQFNCQFLSTSIPRRE